MIARYKQGEKRLLIQPVQLPRLFRASVPYAAEIAADDHIIVLFDALPESINLKTGKIPVCVTGHVYGHLYPPLRFSIPFPQPSVNRECYVYRVDAGAAVVRDRKIQPFSQKSRILFTKCLCSAR